LQGVALERELGYWKSKLAGAANLEIPTDRPRPPQRQSRGANFAFSFDVEVVRSIRRVCLERRTTLFSVLLAGLNLDFAPPWT
jgi:hypothetical protein